MQQCSEPDDMQNTLYYYIEHLHEDKEPMEGFYQITRGPSLSYLFTPYPPTGEYNIVRMEGANSFYRLRDYKQYSTQRRIGKPIDVYPHAPNGLYYIKLYINPDTRVYYVKKREQETTVWIRYEFHPVEHVYYEFQLLNPNHDNSESVVAYNQRNIKERDGNMVTL